VRFVTEQAAAGRLRIPVAAVFPLAEVAQMHERFESRSVSGKLLLEIDGGKDMA
jgi:NADPH:quinone reductase-like Zn-dependent oxidoreductase